MEKRLSANIPQKIIANFSPRIRQSFGFERKYAVAVFARVRCVPYYIRLVCFCGVYDGEIHLRRRD